MTYLKHITFALLVSTIVSCDVIPLDEVEQTVAENENSDLDSATFYPNRKVLLEYYTGHTCGNCPGQGGTTLEQLKTFYGTDLIPLAIHAGFFANPRPAGQPFETDYRTSTGNTLDQKFGVTVTGTPKGMVNRTAYEGTDILTPTAWGSASGQIIGQPSSIGIHIAGTYDLASLTFDIEATITAFENVNGNFSIVSYITETDIINWQRDYDLNPEDIPDYVHKDILRDQLSPNLEFSSLQKNAILEHELSIEVPNNWNTNNCTIIVLVIDNSTNTILQVESLAVVDF